MSIRMLSVVVGIIILFALSIIYVVIRVIRDKRNSFKGIDMMDLSKRQRHVFPKDSVKCRTNVRSFAGGHNQITLRKLDAIDIMGSLKRLERDVIQIKGVKPFDLTDVDSNNLKNIDGFKKITPSLIIDSTRSEESPDSTKGQTHTLFFKGRQIIVDPAVKYKDKEIEKVDIQIPDNMLIDVCV